MNIPSTESFVLKPSDVGAMPPTTALGLAQYLATTNRLAESMDALALVAFEDGGEADSISINYYERSRDIHRLFQSAFLIATHGGETGISRLLDSLERRGADPTVGKGHPSTWGKPSRAVDGMSQNSHHILGAEAFSQLASKLPDSAVEMALRAPVWVCLHQTNHESSHRLGNGFSEALRGAWPLGVSRAYFERDDMVSALLLANNGGFRTARDMVGNFAREFDPKLDAGGLSHLELFLSMVIERSPKNIKVSKSEQSLSPLPAKWMSSFCLGGFKRGRTMLFEAYGRDFCLEVSRRETTAASESYRTIDQPYSWAVEHALDLFAVGDLLTPSNYPLSRSAVARLARAQDPVEFGLSLNLLIERGQRSTIEESCAQRFWVIQEGQSNRSRKQGDALAFCAAEGLIGQAEVLLSHFPDIDRKPVKDTLSYMKLRGTSKHGASLAAWESLVLREVSRACSSDPLNSSLFGAPQPPASSRRRL